MASTRPKPPKGLGKPGRALWRSVMAGLEDGWELDEIETHLLHNACRIEDQAVALEDAVTKAGPVVTGSRGQVRPHPGVSEARQLRLAQERLLRPLDLCDPAQVRAREPLSTQRARKAVEARHAKSRKLAAVGGR